MQYNINLNDENVQFINTAASILMPMYQAQNFLNMFNTQVENSKKAQAAQAKAQLDAQIEEGVRQALASKEAPNVVETD